MDGTFPEGVVADGCRKKCEKNEILIVNVAQNDWECVPKSFRNCSKKILHSSIYSSINLDNSI